MGQVEDGSMTLIETLEDALNVVVPQDKKLAFATQTTLSVDETSQIISALQHRFPEISGPRGEDICYATTNRQQAVKELANKTDYFLVIGAENSSNSKRLVEVALNAGADEAKLIADADALDCNLLEQAQTIGLSAGASAPEILVDEVIAKLSEQFDITIEHQNFVAENLTFKLPSILTK